MHPAKTAVFLAAILLALTSAAAEKKSPADSSSTIQQFFKSQPKTFELTFLTHYSDDDFGFHMQTDALPRGDSMFPQYKISVLQAGKLVQAFAGTTFYTKAKQMPRTSRPRPAKADPPRRVYSITLKCGNAAFIQDVQSDDVMRSTAKQIAAALKGSDVGKSFADAFVAKLAKP